MQRRVRRALAAFPAPLRASDTGASRRSWPDGNASGFFLNIAAAGHVAAGRACRACVVPRVPVPGFFVQVSSDAAHARRRGLRTPGHHTNE